MNAIVPMNFSVVPDFAKQKSAIAQALDGSLNSGIKRLSIKGGTFRYVAGGQEIAKIEERFLDVVMVNAAPHIGRTFYAKAYDGDAKPEAPDCWSPDGTTPDARAKNKQAQNCVQCPKNQKGSGKGESKACRYSQRLAVVLANDISGEVLQLTLPATSIFGEGSKDAGATLQGYYKALSARSIDPAALVTRMKFDTDKEAPTVGFTATGWLTQDQYDSAVRQGKTEAAVRAITMTVFEADGVDAGAGVELPSGAPPVMQQPAAPAASPAPSPAPAASKKTAAVKIDNDVPPPSDEPVVRKQNDVKPAGNPKMQELLAKWGTDDDE